MALLAVLAACEGPPARIKPWRHEPDVPPLDLDAGSALAARDRARAEEGAVRARTLRIRLAAEPSSLNPQVDPDREALHVVEDSVYETLVRHGPDGVTPLLAESFRLHGNVLRFTLRRDVTFHDGRPFTATDAQKAIEQVRRPATARSPRLRAALSMIIAAEAWSARDLRVVLARPDAYALRALAEVPMVPAYVPPGTLAREPVGTGPYRFERWDAGERIVLTRAERYWGAAPAIPTVEFVIEPDGARALLLAGRGEIDILPELVPEHWPEHADTPGLRAAFAPLELAPARYLALALNLERPPFDDLRVRRAANLLVDRPRLAREIWRGLARPVSGPIWPGGPGDAAAPAPPAHDPQRGMALLDEAGWMPERDGVRAREGAKLRVVILSAAAEGDPETELIATGLRRGGFGVDVRTLAAPDVLGRLRTGDFDAAFLDYRGRADEDVCPFFITGGSRNFGNLETRAVDATCAAIRGAWDPVARRAALAGLASLVVAEAPHVPLVAPAPRGLVSRRVKNLVVHDGWFSVRDLELAEQPTGGP